MIDFSDTCLILRKGHFKEIDIWLKVLSPQNGVMTLFAFGGAKSKRRFCGCLDLFNTLQCRIRKSSRNGYFILEEASLTDSVGDLRSNWSNMGIAHNCLGFFNALDVAPDSWEKCFSLLEDLRSALKEAQNLSPLFVLFFRFRMACILGFNPDMRQCVSCKKQVNEDVYFAYDEGRIFCQKCQQKQSLSRKIRLPIIGLDLLRKVKQTFPSQWPAYELLPDIRRACARTMDSFVQYHLGLAYNNGFFRKV